MKQLLWHNMLICFCCLSCLLLGILNQYHGLLSMGHIPDQLMKMNFIVADRLKLQNHNMHSPCMHMHTHVTCTHCTKYITEERVSKVQMGGLRFTLLLSSVICMKYPNIAYSCYCMTQIDLLNVQYVCMCFYCLSCLLPIPWTTKYGSHWRWTDWQTESTKP